MVVKQKNVMFDTQLTVASIILVVNYTYIV